MLDSPHRLYDDLYAVKATIDGVQGCLYNVGCELQETVTYERSCNMGKYARVTVAIVLIVSMSFVFLPSNYVAAGGLVKNQGFEDGEEAIPSGWNLTGNATRVDAGPIYAGNWSAQVTGSNDTLTQWVGIGNVTIGLTFQAWGWIYTAGNVTGAITFDFWAWGGNETLGGNDTVQLSPTVVLSASDTNGAYVQKTAEIQAPPCTTHVRIRLLGIDWGEGDAEVRFDDIGFWLPGGLNFCFIATAAYGTETASQLDILRDFRDQVLLRSSLGSRFVAAYYKLSPPVADFISRHDFLRAVVREMMIDPIVKILEHSQGLWRVQQDNP